MASVPMFLGSDEVSGMFLGADELQEMYLGTDLVYQSGPFEGLKLSPKTISFNSASLTASLKIESSEQWSLTAPAWVSASVSTGDTGETVVTLTATAQTATTQDSIVVTSANYSASASVSYVMNRWVYVDSQSFDRSLPISKLRFHMNNVPAGTPQFSATEGCCSEFPNMDTDGTYSGSFDQATYGYPQSHKFNMVYAGGKYTNGNTTEISINTLPQVETGVYELTTNKIVYWSGVESGASSPIYTNGNLVEVYIDYSA